VRPNQEDNNVSEHIYSKLGFSLHNAHDHPLGVLKARIFFPPGSLKTHSKPYRYHRAQLSL
jgi:hypothetical protein